MTWICCFMNSSPKLCEIGIASNLDSFFNLINLNHETQTHTFSCIFACCNVCTSANSIPHLICRRCSSVSDVSQKSLLYSLYLGKQVFSRRRYGKGGGGHLLRETTSRGLCGLVGRTALHVRTRSLGAVRPMLGTVPSIRAIPGKLARHTN
jgi:hypothetical protein